MNTTGIFSGILAIALFLLIAVGLVLLLFRVIFPATIYRSDRRQREHDIQAVQATGAPLAQTHCGGRIGLLSFRGPLMRLTVYPGGLLIKPIFMPLVALPAHTMTAIRPRKEFWIESLIIEHRAETLVSPLRFACGPQDQVHQRIVAMGQSAGTLQTS